MPIINDILVRELRCKNDNCRKLICFEKVVEGIIIVECPRCSKTSEFNINYGKKRQFIDTLIQANKLEGGE